MKISPGVAVFLGQVFVRKQLGIGDSALAAASSADETRTDSLVLGFVLYHVYGLICALVGNPWNSEELVALKLPVVPRHCARFGLKPRRFVVVGPSYQAFQTVVIGNLIRQGGEKG